MTDRLAAQVTAGFLTEKFFETVVEQLEHGIEERGWDEPCMLFEICSDGVSVESGAALDNMGVVLQGRTLDGHPIDALCGYVTPADCLAVVLSFEGYRHPVGTDLLRNTSKPSENPDRVEERYTLVLSADGRFGQLMRTRDSDAQWVPGSFEEIKEVELDGRVVWGLYAILELSVAGMQYNLLEEVCQDDTIDTLFDPITANFFKFARRVAEWSSQLHDVMNSDSVVWYEALVDVARATISGLLPGVSDREALLRLYMAAVLGSQSSGDWFGPEQAVQLSTLSEEALQIIAGKILDETTETALWLGSPVLTMALRGQRRNRRAVRGESGELSTDIEQKMREIVERSERRVELLRIERGMRAHGSDETNGSL